MSEKGQDRSSFLGHWPFALAVQGMEVTMGSPSPCSPVRAGKGKDERRKGEVCVVTGRMELQRNRWGEQRYKRELTQREIREAFLWSCLRGSVKAQTELGWHDQGEAEPEGRPQGWEGLGSLRNYTKMPASFCSLTEHPRMECLKQ